MTGETFGAITLINKHDFDIFTGGDEVALSVFTRQVFMHAMLCYAMLCYAMLCYAMLCYAMLCYAMLCHIQLSFTPSFLCQLVCLDAFGCDSRICPDFVVTIAVAIEHKDGFVMKRVGLILSISGGRSAILLSRTSTYTA